MRIDAAACRWGPVSRGEKPHGTAPSPIHKENFLFRVRNDGKPVSDIESHVQPPCLCHLNAIAARLKRNFYGNCLHETIVGDDQATARGNPKVPKFFLFS